MQAVISSIGFWLRQIAKSPLIALSFIVLLAMVIVAIFAPQIAPYSPNAQSIAFRLLPPGSDGYILGTDQLGRDVLSRLIWGARLSIGVGFAVMVLTAVVGVILGIISGYFGGIVDSVIMRLVDMWLAFPFLLLAIALVAVLGQGSDKLIFALVLSGWPAFARPVRGEILQLREREYVLSAKVLGVPPLSVMFRHLLPNVMPTILVLAALDLGATILSLAALAFLGLGVDAETASWGGMLASGRNYVATAWWLSTFPGLVIFAVVMASNLIGDWLRDLFDPRSPFRLGSISAAARKRLAEDSSSSFPRPASPEPGTGARPPHDRKA